MDHVKATAYYYQRGRAVRLQSDAVHAYHLKKYSYAWVLYNKRHHEIHMKFVKEPCQCPGDFLQMGDGGDHYFVSLRNKCSRNTAYVSVGRAIKFMHPDYKEKNWVAPFVPVEESEGVFSVMCHDLAEVKVARQKQRRKKQTA